MRQIDDFLQPDRKEGPVHQGVTGCGKKRMPDSEEETG